MRTLVLAILTGTVMACGSKPPSPVVTAHETDCENAMALLVADHAAGKTCEESKAHVALAIPGCVLSFTCRDADGGTQ